LNGRKISSVLKILMKAQIHVDKIPPKTIEHPDQTYQSTQKEKTSFKLGALVWCRPKTLGRESQ